MEKIQIFWRWSEVHFWVESLVETLSFINLDFVSFNLLHTCNYLKLYCNDASPLMALSWDSEQLKCRCSLRLVHPFLGFLCKTWFTLFSPNGHVLCCRHQCFICSALIFEVFLNLSVVIFILLVRERLFNLNWYMGQDQFKEWIFKQ